MTIGRQGFSVPVVAFQITGNSVGGSNETILTFGFDPSSFFNIFDAVVVTFQATTASLTTIGDALIGNDYNGGLGFTTDDLGRNIRIISGTGRFQERTISSIVSPTVLGISTPWNEVPDATSLFIIEDATWAQSSDITPFQSDITSPPFVLTVGFNNIASQTVLVQILLSDSGGSNFSSEQRSPIRMGFVYGSAGSINNPVSAYVWT